MADLGGFGSEFFGDPMGGGGPLHVLAARAIESQTVRVALSEEPVHVSPSGINDALNPSNYAFSVDSGLATSPVCVGVGARLVQGPILGVPSGDWGVDVHTDKALVQGITYRVTLANVQSRTGGDLGAPYSQPFFGVAKITIRRPLPRKVDLTDVANDPFDGGFAFDDSGDLGIDGGINGLRKRMLRRASTPKDAFSHLPGYGCGLRLKKNFSPAQITALRTDLRTQILQEPEVADVAVTVTQPAPGLVFVVMRARTKAGAIVDASTQAGVSGFAIP